MASFTVALIIYLQIAPLLIILPSSALHLPQVLEGSGAQTPPDPPPLPTWTSNKISSIVLIVEMPIIIIGYER